MRNPAENSPPGETPRIFISYAREDSRYALMLFDRFRRAGWQPWLDRKSMLPGENWRQKIAEAVRQSNFFVALLSPESVSKRGYVQKEYKMALDVLAERPAGDVYLIPVRLGECEIPDYRVSENSTSMSDLQWLDLPLDREWTDEDIQPLIDSVTRYCSSVPLRPEPAHSQIPAFTETAPRRKAPDPLDENLIATMQPRDLPYTDEILALLYETPRAELTARAERAYDAYHEVPLDKLYALPQTDYFLIARHLYRCIRDNEPKVCRRRPFIFTIHQFLSGMVHSADPPEQAVLTGILRQWLLGRQSVYQTARDFAAFELGMCRVRAAVPELLDCVRNPDEFTAVRSYGAMALGMIGDSSVIDELAALADRTQDPELRKIFLHVVYRLGSV